MQKISSRLLAACLALSGCSHPSSPWSTAKAVRVDTRDSDDPSATYAEQLSGVLKTANVQHKIVTYEYRYRTALREEAIATRTAVLYRDDKNPENPWWLMEDGLFKPVWLPGEDENRQVSFFLHRPATVVSTQTIGGADGKGVIAAPSEPTRQGAMVARLEPVRRNERSFRWPNWFSQRPQAPALARANPRQQPAIRQSRPGITTGPGGDSKVVNLFRARHGTDFDPVSEIDRRKMEQLLLDSGTRSVGVFGVR